MRYIVKFNIYESITDQVNRKLTDEFYLLIDENSKRSNLFLCKGAELFSFCSIVKSYNYEMVASTTIKPGYGIFIYEAALMHAYPDMVYSDRSGSTEDACVIWDRYAKRTDVEKTEADYPLDNEDNNSANERTTPYEGQLYMYRKTPEKWFNDLVERGKKYEYLMDQMMSIASDAWGKY